MLLRCKPRQGCARQRVQHSLRLQSYRYYPSNIDVIEWLGAYYIDAQFSEKAVNYFERASIMQPNEVKWQLMMASCYRRSGNYQKALDTYKTIHRRFPDNVECECNQRSAAVRAHAPVPSRRPQVPGALVLRPGHAGRTGVREQAEEG